MYNILWILQKCYRFLQLLTPREWNRPILQHILGKPNKDPNGQIRLSSWDTITWMAGKLLSLGNMKPEETCNLHAYLPLNEQLLLVCYFFPLLAQHSHQCFQDITIFCSNILPHHIALSRSKTKIFEDSTILLKSSKLHYIKNGSPEQQKGIVSILLIDVLGYTSRAIIFNCKSNYLCMVRIMHNMIEPGHHHFPTIFY